MGTNLMTRRRRLLGRGELRKLFGVSHTRTIQITQRPDFPEPLDELSVGQIWDYDQVIAWSERTGRTLHLDALDSDGEDEAG